MGIEIAKTNLYAVDAPPTNANSIDATMAKQFVVARLAAEQIDATKALAFTVYNVPTPQMLATMARALPVIRANHEIRATKAFELVVCRGRLARPAVSPWYYAIDGHIFLVINLPDETLVYDFLAERWSVYGNGELPIWNPQNGQNWIANIGFIQASLASTGQLSNVVCGDGTTSALYFLDPELDEDYSPLGDAGKPFARIITGQLLSRTTDYLSLPSVTVFSSEGETVDAADMTVTLEGSDDQGHTYNSYGSRSVVLGTYSTELEWRSLGSYKQPGRLLRLTDRGALRRVDDWTVPDGD